MLHLPTAERLEVLLAVKLQEKNVIEVTIKEIDLFDAALLWLVLLIQRSLNRAAISEARVSKARYSFLRPRSPISTRQQLQSYGNCSGAVRVSRGHKTAFLGMSGCNPQNIFQ